VLQCTDNENVLVAIIRTDGNSIFSETEWHTFILSKKNHQLLATGNLIWSVQKVIAKCFPNIKQPAAIHGNNLFFKGGKTLAKKQVKIFNI
jgi:hypothetical protein